MSFVRRSTIATDILGTENRLQADNITRWNSQLKMIKSVLTIPETRLSELEGPPNLSHHDRNILQDIVNILTPFEEATDFVQVECVPSAGYVLPCEVGLAHHVQGLVSHYNLSFIQGLKESLEKRMPYYEHNETYILAAILDHRFKLRWCSDEAVNLRSKEVLKAAVEKINPVQVHVEGTSEPPLKKSKTLFSFMLEPEAETNSFQSQSNTDNYLAAPCVSMDTNPANYWKENHRKYPSLANIAKEVLGIPSSSSAIERLFSIAGKVFTPERCRLSDDRFE